MRVSVMGIGVAEADAEVNMQKLERASCFGQVPERTRQAQTRLHAAVKDRNQDEPARQSHDVQQVRSKAARAQKRVMLSSRSREVELLRYFAR